MLTSFGLSQLRRRDRSLFSRMPPMLFDGGPRFRVDVAPLLFGERLVVDEVTYRRLQESGDGLFAENCEVLRALYEEGFLRLENFSRVVDDNATLLDEMLSRDLRE